MLTGRTYNNRANWQAIELKRLRSYQLFVYINWFKWEKFCCRHTHTLRIRNKQCHPRLNERWKKRMRKKLTPNNESHIQFRCYVLQQCTAIARIDKFVHFSMCNQRKPSWAHTHTHNRKVNAWGKTLENAKTSDKEWQRKRYEPNLICLQVDFLFERTRDGIFFPLRKLCCFSAYSFKLFKTIMAQLYATGFFFII